MDMELYKRQEERLRKLSKLRGEIDAWKAIHDKALERINEIMAEVDDVSKEWDIDKLTAPNTEA